MQSSCGAGSGRHAAGAVLFALALGCAGAPVHADANKQDRLVLVGAGGGGDALYGYAGLAYALHGSIDEPGPRLRLWLKSYGFDYRTTIAATPARIDATGYGAAAEAGYQWTRPGRWRLAAYAGLRLRDHQLSPDDPGSGLDEMEVGAGLTLDGERRLGRGFVVSGNWSYTAGFEQYWLQSRLGYDFAAGFRAGPEIVFLGGDEYEYRRYGAFVSHIAIDRPSLGRLFLSLEAGAQHDVDEGETDFYGGLHTSFFF